MTHGTYSGDWTSPTTSSDLCQQKLVTCATWENSCSTTITLEHCPMSWASFFNWLLLGLRFISLVLVPCSWIHVLLFLGQPSWFWCSPVVFWSEWYSEVVRLHVGQPGGVVLPPALQALDPAVPPGPSQPHCTVHCDVLQRAVWQVRH